MCQWFIESNFNGRVLCHVIRVCVRMCFCWIFFIFLFIIYLTFLNFRRTFVQTLNDVVWEFSKNKNDNFVLVILFFARSTFDKIVIFKLSKTRYIVYTTTTTSSRSNNIKTMTIIKLYSRIHLHILTCLLYELNYIFLQFFSSYFAIIIWQLRHEFYVSFSILTSYIVCYCGMHTIFFFSQRNCAYTFSVSCFFCVCLLLLFRACSLSFCLFHSYPFSFFFSLVFHFVALSFFSSKAE